MARDFAPTNDSEKLLEALAEQLKVPLLHISTFSELARSGRDVTDLLPHIEVAADRALHFIDSYLLSNNLIQRQVSLQLEPVSLASVLYDTAHRLDGLAKQYGSQLELEIGGRYEPVMANREGLEYALANIGQVLIEAQSHQAAKSQRLVMGAHRRRGGIVAGVYADVEGLNANALNRARALHGKARHPLSDVVASSGAGLFIAESILSSMSAQLRVAKHHRRSGLAATFVPSQQLALV